MTEEGAASLADLGSPFNFDFGVAFSAEDVESGRTEHNLHSDWDRTDVPEEAFRGPDEMPPKDLPGVSAFALEDGVV